MADTAGQGSGGPVSLGVFLGNYNHAQYLPGALNALLAQELLPARITVVDDGSTDDSIAILERYANRHPSIRFTRNTQNKGYIRNANEWLAQSEDEFVYFAASDDLTLPAFFRKSIALLQATPSAGLCSSLCYILDEGSNVCRTARSPLARTAPGYVSPVDAATVLYKYGAWLWGTGTVYRRLAVVRADGFDSSLHGYTDTFLSMSIALREGSLFIPEPLAIWRRFMRNSISAVTLLEIGRSAQILNNVLLKLKSDLGSYLVPGYERRFARRWLFDVLERQSVNSAKFEESDLGHLLNLHAPELLSLLPLLNGLHPRVRRALLAVILRPQDIAPAIGRRLALQSSTIPAP